MTEKAGRRRPPMRCPSCYGSGEPFLRVETDCSECHGSGALDTSWRWLRAWRLVAGRIGALLFLLVGGWCLCAIPGMFAISALFSAFGIGDNWDWLAAFRWLTILFAAGSTGFALCYVQGHGARRHREITR